MRAATDDLPVRTLGLADLNLDELPQLEITVTNSKSETIADVIASLTALIVSPENKVLYLEAVCTSDSGAHAIMGAVSDTRGSVEFRFYREADEDYIDLAPPESPRVANVRLAVNGWSRHVHHVAMLDRSDDLILAADDAALWRKLREKMTCPTLVEWGDALLPGIQKSGALLTCESFGLPDQLRAYVFAADAQQTFDRLISAHVQNNGLTPHERSRYAKQSTVRDRRCAGERNDVRTPGALAAGGAGCCSAL